jgi:hypothetical protein
MSTIDYPEPNTTVGRLHLSLNGDYENSRKNQKKEEVIDMIKELIEEDSRMPTGATIIEGTGLWFPRTDGGEIDEDKKEIEDNVIIEFWLDSVEEFSRIREFKDILETRLDQFCVCLSVEDRYYEH